MNAILPSIILALLCCNAFSLEEVRYAANDVGKKITVYGDLNVPLGKTVTITGEKRRVGLYDNVFWVDTINGKKVKSGMNILVAGIEQWSDGTTAKLYGYEQGKFTLSKDHKGVKLEHQMLLLSFKIVRLISSDKPAAPITK